MGKWAKFIGAGLGFACLGPLGGILGYYIGKNIGVELDFSGPFNNNSDYIKTNRGNILFTNILGFMAAIVKADKVVKTSEIKEVMSSLEAMYNLDAVDMRMAKETFDQMLNTSINVRELAESFNKYANKPMKLVLLSALFNISLADGAMNSQEEKMINNIARYIGLSEYEVRSVKASRGYNEGAGRVYTSGEELKRAYDVLGVTESDSQEEIKKQYRELVKQYHPDQFQSIDEAAHKMASEKMSSINNAYNTIKKARGF